MSSLQTILPMRAERITVLQTVYNVRARLGLNEDEALALARLDWGFDIASGSAKVRELRLLQSTVDHFEQLGRPRQAPLGWQDVREELLRGAVKTLNAQRSTINYVQGTTAQLILNCSSKHLNSFIPLQFRLVPGTRYSSGPNGTPKITVESFLEFLRKRRVR